MYSSIENFINDWGEESKFTQKILDALTDESLSLKVYPEGRSIGDIAWHIVKTHGDLGKATGLDINAPAKDSDSPDKASVISEEYGKTSASLTAAIKNNWQDNMITEEVEVYGQKWSRGFLLQAQVKHEIHHRAQLTVLMRQAGLKVPGLYGPSKEEWVNYGMEPQK